MSTPTSSRTGDDSAIKTISKKTVYLPLVAYDYKSPGSASGTSCGPDGYMASRKSLPNSVQEKTLVDFWHKVGVDYHHRRATTNDSKNNGNRPLSLPDMEERIRSRAMTLVGGGFHTAWDTTTATLSTTAKNPNNKKAKTLPQQQQLSRKQQMARKRRRESKAAMHFATNDENETESVGRFLYDLNALWNDYIFKLIGLSPNNKSVADYQTLARDTQLWARVTSCITNETAQLVGARVQIKACPQRPSWAGRIGYVVGKTQNTWNVMVHSPVPVAKKQKKKRRRQKPTAATTNTANDKVDITDTGMGWKALFVPKRGSMLSLLIPIGTTNSIQGEAETKKSEAKVNSKSPDATSPILAIDIQEDV